VQPFVHHLGIEVARRAGGDRLGDDARGADAARIVVGREISGEHADSMLAAHRPRGRLEYGGLARARRSHQIHRLHAELAEVLAIVTGGAIVGGQDPLVHVHRNDLRISTAA
jgi:hypothetical protein